jgi:peptidoglycan/LPS O-acetylase OafA/YrhL
VSDAVPAAAPARPSNWLPGLECLRGIAALTVVVHHSWGLSTRTQFPGWQIVEGFGTWGVDLFFLLSGYLLGEWFWTERRHGRLRAFWVRRVFRIVPAYYASVVVLFAFFADHAQLFSHQGFKQVIANLTFTHYLFPGTSSSLNVDGAWWTLTIEMILYLLIPIMALSMKKRPVVASSTMVAIGVGYVLWVALAGEWLQRFMFGSLDGDTPVQRLFLARQFPGQLPLFAIGLLLRWAVVNGKIPSWLIGTRSGLFGLVVRLLPSVAWLFFIERASNYTHWVWFAFFPLVLAALFVPVILYASAPMDRSAIDPATKVGVWFGLRSYGIYLWHFPLILTVLGRGPGINPPDTTHLWLRLAVIYVGAIVFGAVSYAAIEEPARRYGKRLSDRMSGPVVRLPEPEGALR